MNRFRSATTPAGPLPIFVGALRPGMLALAGEVGDGVCLNLMPPRVVVRQLVEVRRGAQEAGRTLPTDFGVMARLQTVVTDEPAGIREMLRNQFLGPYLAQPVYNQFLAWMGYEEEAAAIAAGWAARDREAVAAAIHDRLIDDLVLVGDASHVRERLDELRRLGFDGGRADGADALTIGGRRHPAVSGPMMRKGSGSPANDLRKGSGPPANDLRKGSCLEIWRVANGPHQIWRVANDSCSPCAIFSPGRS